MVANLMATTAAFALKSAQTRQIIYSFIEDMPGQNFSGDNAV